jgi:hypothetical protein
VAGSPIEILRRDFAAAASSIEDLSRFIEDLFVYRLPWGFGGYLRIAAQLLELPEISFGAQFFPTMVKFGVPFPEAAWAMAAGVPMRRVAISLANDFLRQGRDRGYKEFLDWLAYIELDPLQQEHGLSGSLLDDVSRALRRAGRNQLLATREDVGSILPLKVDVRGVAHSNRRTAARRMQGGDAVTLDREYDNVVDQNAIRVLSGAEELGYLPRDVAQLLAPEIDTGLEVSATVADIGEAEVPRITVVLAANANAGV